MVHLRILQVLGGWFSKGARPAISSCLRSASRRIIIWRWRFRGLSRLLDLAARKKGIIVQTFNRPFVAVDESSEPGVTMGTPFPSVQAESISSLAQLSANCAGASTLFVSTCRGGSVSSRWYCLLLRQVEAINGSAAGAPPRGLPAAGR